MNRNIRREKGWNQPENTAGRRRLSQERTAAERRQARKELGISLAFLSPSLIGVLIFFVVPFFVVIYYAFVNNPVLHEFVGFDNFKYLLKNQSFRLAAKNTAIFSGISVPAAVVLSLLLACMLNRKIPLKSQFRTAMLSPLMVPVASVVLIWQVVFSYNGALNALIGQFGLDKVDWMKSGFNRYVDGGAEFLRMDAQDEPFDQATDPERLEDIQVLKWLAVILVPLLTALVACLVMKGKMKTARKQTHADAYIPQNGVRLTRQDDVYVTTTQTRVKIETQKSGGGTTVNSGGFSHSSGKF